jgi:uncharacterized protein YqfA (UPF0365 family)
MNRQVLMGALLVVVPVLGCASYPAPQQHVTDSVAAVRAAEEVGAASQPQAALNLKLAQEELGKANALMKDGDNEQADFMAMRARADADLARSLAKEQQAKTRADEHESAAKAVENGATVIPTTPASPALPASPSTVSPSLGNH